MTQEVTSLVPQPRVGSFTAAEREERRGTLGASEIAAVAGVHPYMNALDVFLRKTGRVEETPQEEYAEWGLRLESVIATKYADTHGVSLILGEKAIHPTETWMSATPDRWVLRDWGEKFTDLNEIERGLELKNRNAHIAHLFGESGSDIVPMDIASQCHWSMIVTGLTAWDIAVLIGGNTFRWYRLAYDADIASALQERGWEFWTKHVLTGIEPPIDGSESWTRHLKKKFAKHTEVILEADAETHAMIRHCASLKAVAKAAQNAIATSENQIKAAIGDAAGIAAPDGTRATWKRSKDSTGPDYQAIAFELAVQADLSLDQQRALQQKHTVVQAHGSRRFLITLPKE